MVRNTKDRNANANVALFVMDNMSVLCLLLVSLNPGSQKQKSNNINAALLKNKTVNNVANVNF